MMNCKRLLTTTIVAVTSAAVTAVVVVRLASPTSTMALSGEVAPAADATGSVAVGAPTVMTYQGYLTYAGGAPIDGTVNLSFSIYTAESNGTIEWGPETHNGVQVTDGYFTVLLGETDPLDAEVFSGEERWLAVTVNGTPMPRQRIAAVPYAIQSAGTPPGCRVIATETQTIPDLVSTPLTFTTEIHDTANCWSPANPTRLVAQTSGYYMAGGAVTYNNGQIVADARIIVMVYKNGTINLQSNEVHAHANNWVTASVATGMFHMEAGEYVEILAYQNLGIPIETDVWTSDLTRQQRVNGWLVRVD
jgi:hypothetical protein